ncbi:16S rRNA (guanine(527)-N(7))-methyltransferase RsmG, partial [Bacteroidota bacterium]
MDSVYYLEHIRAEKVQGKFDFIISRAVTRLKAFYTWIENNIDPDSFNDIDNGILYLKGGDLNDELNDLNKKHLIFNIKDY